MRAILICESESVVVYLIGSPAERQTVVYVLICKLGMAVAGGSDLAYGLPCVSVSAALDTEVGTVDLRGCLPVEL